MYSVLAPTRPGLSRTRVAINPLPLSLTGGLDARRDPKESAGQDSSS